MPGAAHPGDAQGPTGGAAHPLLHHDALSPACSRASHRGVFPADLLPSSRPARGPALGGGERHEATMWALTCAAHSCRQMKTSCSSPDTVDITSNTHRHTRVRAPSHMCAPEPPRHFWDPAGSSHRCLQHLSPGKEPTKIPNIATVRSLTKHVCATRCLPRPLPYGAHEILLCV